MIDTWTTILSIATMIVGFVVTWTKVVKSTPSFADLDKMQTTFDKIDRKLDRIELRLDDLNEDQSSLRERVAVLEFYREQLDKERNR